MSKLIKDLVSKDVSRRVIGVSDAVLVNVIGLDAIKTTALRKRLRDKNIQLLVIKNSLAARATRGTSLQNAFEGAAGTLALMWGSEDFISLCKEVTKLDGDVEFEKFQARGGVMDGEHLTAERVKEISKWPNRQQQLSILVGQVLSVGAQLSSQLLGPAGALASQIEKKGEGAESEGEQATQAS